MTAETRRYAIVGRRNGEVERVEHMLTHMAANKAYVYAAEAAGGDPDGRLLERFRKRFRNYRTAWREQPRKAVAARLLGDDFRKQAMPPLCVDIEVAAVCDLGCPFCYRQFIATPDKIIDDELFYRLIDQCAELGVPSVKLNWRGEPLLHPKLPQFVDYAKRKGILDTIINTNATTLDEKKSRALIEAGIDFVIFSFDGGTKKSYETMRPGRFNENSFDLVYGNIRRFAEIRAEMGAKLPRTRIQMILTADTFHEQEQFFALFDDCVDDVAVKQYTERGGNIAELDVETRARLDQALRNRSMPKDATYMREPNGDIFVATGRLPCEQPYQRMLVTYDGRASMCCYDWGSQHPVGYVDQRAIDSGEKEYETIVAKARAGAKGFEMMPEVNLPLVLNRPKQSVHTLSEIWYGKDIEHVRRCHLEDRAGELDICRTCRFKETYRWEKL